MKIIRCDICKKEKSRDDFFKTLVLPVSGASCSAKGKSSSVYSFSFKEVDLCCDCLDHLKIWFRNEVISHSLLQ